MNSFIIPCFILIIIVSGIYSKQKVFDLFIEGVKEGLLTIINLFPILLGLFLAVSLLRASGIISYLSNFCEPILNLFKIPKELIGIIFLKPISGSASLAIITEIIQEYGSNSIISFIGAIIMGSTETLVYAIAVYTGNINKKMSYKVVLLAILGNILAVMLASFFGRIFF